MALKLRASVEAYLVKREHGVLRQAFGQVRLKVLEGIPYLPVLQALVDNAVHSEFHGGGQVGGDEVDIVGGLRVGGAGAVREAGLCGE